MFGIYRPRRHLLLQLWCAGRVFAPNEATVFDLNVGEVNARVLSSPDAFRYFKTGIEGVCAGEVAQSEFKPILQQQRKRSTPERRGKTSRWNSTLRIWARHGAGSYFCRKPPPRR